MALEIVEAAPMPNLIAILMTMKLIGNVNPIAASDFAPKRPIIERINNIKKNTEV